MTTFSVLVCTFNRPDMLTMALEALIERTTEKPDQVVVVNGGDDRSDLVVQKYMSWPGVQVQLVKTANVNLAVSRNIGFSHCTGDIIATTDDDAEVFPDWVTQMKHTHSEHPEAGGVGGAVLGAGSVKSLFDRVADVTVFPTPSEPGYVRTLAGVNISYKRSIMQSVGLQDETLFRGEDVDYNWRIKRAGYEIYYSPEIRVIHHHRPTLGGLMNQFYMYGRAYYLVRRKWPEMYSVFPQRVSSVRDFLRLVYFIISTFSEPFISSMKMSSWIDRILALPILYLLHIAWKSGILIQKFESSASSDHNA